MNGPLMMDLETDTLSLEEKRLIQDERVGGVILFARNFSSADQIQCLCASIKNIREELILAVDQEGGRVQRFQKGFTKLPAVTNINKIALNQNIDNIEVARQLGWLMATEIRSVGVDISFAPVLDLDKGNSQIIGDRAFGNTVEKVIQLAGSYINGMHQAGMPACGKHFPGHGAVAEDSHLELPVDNRSRTELMMDIQPFQKLSSKLSGMMPAHVLYPAVDALNPAGFSSLWIKEILRKQLKFKGVVFSDDLSMEGAACFGNYCDRARKAINAGCDMVLICNNRKAVKEVLSSTVFNQENLLNKSKSSDRIKRLKNNKFLIEYSALEQHPLWQKAQALTTS